MKASSQAEILWPFLLPKVQRVARSAGMTLAGGNGNGPYTLAGAYDVQLAGLLDGQMLAYQQSIQKWVNVMPPTGGGGGVSYTAGNGISIVGTTIATRQQSAGGIAADASGLYILKPTNSGLNLSASGLAVGPGQGIDVAGGTVAVDVTDIIDTTFGLTESGNKMRIALDSAGGMAFGATGALKLATPSTVSVSSINQSTSTGHSHDVATASDTMSGGASILASDSAGKLALAGLTLGGDLAFTGATMRNITSVNALTIKTTAANADIIFDPTGVISYPNSQESRTVTQTDSITGIKGLRIFDNTYPANTMQLNINAIKVDNLYARKFTVDEWRVSRGAEAWSKSFGIVETTIALPATGASIDVWFEEAPDLGSVPIFDRNDWIQFRTIDAGSGLLIQTIWFKVVGVDATNDWIQRQAAVTGDATTPSRVSRQQWRLTRMSGGFSGMSLSKGSTGVDFGQPSTGGSDPGQGAVTLSALQEDGGPWIQIETFNSVIANVPDFKNRTRMGNLNGVIDYTVPTWGFAAGADLNVLPSAGFSGIAVDNLNGARLFNTDVRLYEGSILSTQLSRSYGLSLLNDDTIHGHDLRNIAWFDDLSNLAAANATAKMSTWGPTDDRRFVVSTYGRTLASVMLEANGKSGVQTSSISVWSGGLDGHNNGVILLSAQNINLGTPSDIGLPAAKVRIGAFSGQYADSNLHVYDNTHANNQFSGITMQADGDPLFHWQTTGGTVFTAGVDVTDNKWKLASGWVLGLGNEFITLDTATGTVTIKGLTVGPSAPSNLVGGDGIDLIGPTIQVDATVVRTSRSVGAGDGLQGGGSLGSNISLAVDSSVVRTSRRVNTSGALAGGNSLASDLTLALTLAGYSGLTQTGGLQLADTVAGAGLDISATKVLSVDNTVVRTGQAINTTLPLIGGGLLGGDLTLGLQLASPSGLISGATGLAVADTIAGYGLKITAKVLSLDTTIVLTGAHVINVAGAIGGGGSLATDPTISLTLTAGGGLTQAGNSLALDTSVVRTSRKINTGSGLLGGDDLTADITLSVDTTVVRTSRLVDTAVGGGLVGGGTLAGNLSLGVDATVVRTSRQVVTPAGGGILGGANFANDVTLTIDFTKVVPTSRLINTVAGSGLIGGGNLTGDRSLSVDFSLVVSTSRTLTAGAGMVGGGNLSLDRTFDVVAGNGTLTVNPDNLVVNQAFTFAWTGTQTWAAAVSFNGAATFNAALIANQNVSLNAPGILTVGQAASFNANVTLNTPGALTVHQASTFDGNVNLIGPGALAIGQVATFTANAFFNAPGVYTFSTAPQINANLNFIGGDRVITGSANLAITPAANLTLSPTGGIVYTANSAEQRSTTYADLVGGIQGFRLFTSDVAHNYSQLTIGAIKTDNLIATAFTTNLVRLEQADSYWGKGFGIVSGGFTLPAVGADVNVTFDNVSNISGQIFAVNDLLQCRLIIWVVGVSLKVVWFKVKAFVAYDDPNFRQTWTLTRMAGGADNDPVPAGTVMEDAGVAGQGWIHVTSQTSSGGPYMEFGQQNTYVSGAPTFTNTVRIGQLSGTVDYGAGNYWGFVTGQNLAKPPTDSTNPFSGITVDSTKGLRLFNSAYQLFAGANLILAMDKTRGLSFEQGSNEYNSVTWYADLGADATAPLNVLANVGTHPDTTPYQEVDIYGWGNPTSAFTKGAVRLRAFSAGYNPPNYVGSDYSFNLWVDADGIGMYRAGGDPGGSVAGDNTARFTKDLIYFQVPLVVGAKTISGGANFKLELRAAAQVGMRFGGGAAAPSPRFDIVQDTTNGVYMESYNDATSTALPFKAKASSFTFWDWTYVRGTLATNGFWGFGQYIDQAAPIAELEVYTTLGNAIRGLASTHINTDINAPMIGTYKARGTRAAKTAIVSGDYTGYWAAHGWDGSAWVSGASIVMRSSGTIAAGSIPADIRFRTGTTGGGTDSMVILSSGFVGINATNTATPNTPEFRFDMQDTGAASSALTIMRLAHQYYDGVSVGEAVGIRFDFGIAGNLVRAGAMIQAVKTGLYTATGNRSARLAFLTSNAGVLTEYMTILPSGLVGVGTSAPTSNFHVWVNQNANTQLSVQNDTSGTSAAASFKAFVGTAYAEFGKRSPTTSGSLPAPNDFYIYNSPASGDISIINAYASGNINLATGGATQLRINSAGNMGFNTTDIESWNTGFGVLEWFRNAIMVRNVSPGGMYINDNAYYDTTPAWKFKSAAAASYLQMYAGTFSWSYNDPAVTPVLDAVIGWKVGFYVDASGHFGIGNYSAPATALDVRWPAAASVVARTTDDTAGSYAEFTAFTNGADVGAYVRAYDTLNTGTRYGAVLGGAVDLIATGTGLTAMLIGTNTLNVPIIFGQANAERMRIDNGGLVGIQQANPSSFFHVGALLPTINVAPSNGGLLWGTNTPQQSISMRNSGAVETGLLNWTATGYVGTFTNHPFVIRSNNADRITVAAAGGVTIATATTLSSTLTVAGVSNLGNTAMGAGVSTPQGSVHAHDGNTGFLMASKTGVTTTVQKILPAGAITKSCTIYQVDVRESSGGWYNPGILGTAMIPNNGTMTMNATSIFMLRCNTDGSLDVYRSSGTGTATISVLLWYQ